MPKVIHKIKLEVKGGAAAPGAQFAPLSSKGIKAIEVCKHFNDQTQDRKGKLLRLQVLQFEDKSYQTVIKDTPIPQLLMEMANIKKGSSEPNRDKVASITQAQLQKLAERKKQDTNAFTIEAVMKTIQGTARNMGITIN